MLLAALPTLPLSSTWEVGTPQASVSRLHVPGPGCCGRACLGHLRHFPRVLCSSTCSNTCRSSLQDPSDDSPGVLSLCLPCFSLQPLAAAGGFCCPGSQSPFFSQNLHLREGDEFWQFSPISCLNCIFNK